jgi:hypothetical protein
MKMTFKLKQHQRLIRKNIAGARLVASCSTPNSDICGIVQLADKIYVCYYEVSTVDLFQYRQDASLGQLEGITIDSLNPCDMTGCSQTRQLFIADNVSNSIWIVDIKSSDKRRIGLDCTPWTLSMNHVGRLLVTPYGGNSLYVYTVDNINNNGRDPDNNTNNRCVVTLPSRKDAVHALETNKGAFVVCGYSSESETSRRPDVIQVDRRGHIKRTFDGRSALFRDPKHLSVVGGMILVVDETSGDVVGLDNQLRLQRLVIDGHKTRYVVDRPSRLHYSTENRRLAVGLQNKRIDIFDLRF